MRNHYLLRALSHTPEIARRILDHVDLRRYDEPLDPDRFTLRQAMAHLADWEPIMLDRLHACAERRSTIEAFDESARCVEHGYDDTDPKEQVQVWAQRRKATLAYLGSLTEDDWAGETTHPERGAMSAYDWAGTLLAHDVYHVEQFARYLPDDQPVGTW